MTEKKIHQLSKKLDTQRSSNGHKTIFHIYQQIRHWNTAKVTSLKKTTIFKITVMFNAEV